MNRVTFDSQGLTGNIFHILGLVQTQLHKEKRINDFNECRDRVLAASSYDQALAIIREYVNLVDRSGVK